MQPNCERVCCLRIVATTAAVIVTALVLQLHRAVERATLQPQQRNTVVVVAVAARTIQIHTNTSHSVATNENSGLFPEAAYNLRCSAFQKVPYDIVASKKASLVLTRPATNRAALQRDRTLFVAHGIGAF